jgi:superfamily II DNA or RNA helicase
MPQPHRPTPIIAPGSRIVVRDAEWLVRKVDRTTHDSQAITAVGLSEIVKDKESVFLSDLERQIKVLRPEQTRLVHDPSRAYSHSRLYLESLLRQSPPTDHHVYLGHRAAIDLLPFQVDPAIQALQQPRHRILIADAVGLGKTIECGILLTELIKRGRGKRILVLAVKSMLTQFQKELWARFTIPLVRLDSIGIQRIRRNIPTNHNPFYYYDRAIISIDTLKQEAEYRTYIENAWWDIIVIDEAHNIAERGTHSMRARLARLLADRSDTLILLSATPHDGKKRSFASIMNMLDPTAIADPDHYGPDDIQGLFIRRHKKDVKDQVASSFKDRVIERTYCPATPAEEAVFDAFSQLRFSRIDQRRGGHMLFRTTLEKALLSSPAACIDTIRNRVRRLEREAEAGDADADARGRQADIESLSQFQALLQRLAPADIGKYQQLLAHIRQSGWTGRDPADRLVIFTERIETLRFLEDNLPRDLKLKPAQVALLYGSLSDIEQQAVVEAFGREQEPVRLLLASDVAAEGINLHYLCHRLIHYDIPWSLLIFQQRNGRIDRYGQTETPRITYLITQSANAEIQGDLRILEILTEKDQQVVDSIGDPSEFTGRYDPEAEEAHTANAIENEVAPAQFEASLQQQAPDPLAILMGGLTSPTGQSAREHIRNEPSLFTSDFDYARAGLGFIGQTLDLQVTAMEQEQLLSLAIPPELEHRLRYLPPEVTPKQDSLMLSADREEIQKEIAQCRKEEREWPTLHLLWPQHPVLEWINDKVTTAFGRHEAPVITLPGNVLPAGDAIFIVSGLIPNRKGHPIVHHWFGLHFRGDKFAAMLELDEVLDKTGLHRQPYPNPGLQTPTEPLARLLPKVVQQALDQMTSRRDAYQARVEPQMQQQQKRLEQLKQRRMANLRPNQEIQRHEIDQLFQNHRAWVEDTLMTENQPFIRIAAVVVGGG